MHFGDASRAGVPLHLAYSWVPVAAVQIAELAARVARVSLHVAMADAAADDDDDVQPCPWARGFLHSTSSIVITDHNATRVNDII